MTLSRVQIAKHLTAAAVAVAMACLLLLGFDGMLVAMHKLANVVSAEPAPPPAPAPAPAPAAAAQPGVVQTFIVPASKAAPPGDDTAGERPADP
jgi:hypothetical protein